MKNTPSVSIVTPLYNAEKYIGECLDSILNQTFQDFEVVVVNDCSTDNSCAVVESYKKKFDGRLTLSHMEKNSGSGALPRNKGIILSRGEYIFFVDADDLITPTALEEMYSLAENYNADVVYCEKYFMSKGTGQEFKDNLHIATERIQAPPFVSEPTFETNDLAERIDKIMNRKFWVTPWLKMVSRNLLLENNIFFPHVCISEDNVWTYGLLFYAKNFLRVPNAVYIRRLTEDSMMGRKKTPQQMINFWINPVLLGVKNLDDLMSKVEFFKTNPQYRYAVLEHFISLAFACTFQASLQLPPFAFYETIKQEFGKFLGEHDVLISLLCTFLSGQQKTAMKNMQEVNQFAAQARRRISDLEKINVENAAYISELENFIAASQKRIAELENEINLLKGRE